MHPNQFDLSKYDDVSVIDDNNQRIIVLVCEDQYSAKHLNDVLRFNKFQITAGITESKSVILDTKFPDANYRVQFKTINTTLEDPTLIWILQGSVPYITTGFLDYNDTLLRPHTPLRIPRPSLN